MGGGGPFAQRFCVAIANTFRTICAPAKSNFILCICTIMPKFFVVVDCVFACARPTNEFGLTKTMTHKSSTLCVFASQGYFFPIGAIFSFICSGYAPVKYCSPQNRGDFGGVSLRSNSARKHVHPVCVCVCGAPTSICAKIRSPSLARLRPLISNIQRDVVRSYTALVVSPSATQPRLLPSTPSWHRGTAKGGNKCPVASAASKICMTKRLRFFLNWCKATNIYMCARFYSIIITTTIIVLFYTPVNHDPPDKLRALIPKQWSMGQQGVKSSTMGKPNEQMFGPN